MNALPLADSQDWLGPPARARAADGAADDAADHGRRLSLAQQSFLELRLEAAMGRLAAMETLIEAERLHLRQARAALAVSERALEQQRDATLQSDRQRQAAAAEIGRLKEALHEAAIEKARQASRIAALDSALAERATEIARLGGAGTTVEAELRAARAQHVWATDALQRECLRLEESVQGERRDKLLLQRALDLARANRRALQDQLLALSAPSHAIPALPALAEPPHRSTLGEDGPAPPALPALTEQSHAACR